MKKMLTKFLAVVLCVVMALTAAPLGGFVASAAEGDLGTITFGTYNDAPLIWNILEEKENGDLVLITQGSIGRVKYFDITSAVVCNQTNNYSTSNINKFLNDGESSFYATAFTADEKALVKATETTYIYYDTVAKAKTTGILTANVVIPSEAMISTYGIGAISAAYWLTDGAGTAAAKASKIMNTTGKIGNAGNHLERDCRPMITIEAVTTGKFEAVEGITYMVNGTAVEGYTSINNVLFSVAVDDNYSSDNLVVKLGDTTLTPVDGVYTIPAGSTETVTVSDVTVLPADFTAYNEARAKAESINRDLCTEESLAALDEALNADVSGYTTILDQDKIDAATKAITKALALIPADTAAYLEALEQLRVVYANEPIQITETQNAPLYNLDALDETGISYKIVITKTLREFEDNTDTPISTFTADRQAEVDAATAEINALIASIPYKAADISEWLNAIERVRNIKPELYSNAAELNAQVNAIIAENNYEELVLDITHQAEIDASTQEILTIFAQREELKLEDVFADLGSAVDRSATYSSNQAVYCNTNVWDAFITNLTNANVYLADKEAYSDVSYRAQIISAKNQLTAAMDEMDICVALATDSSADESVTGKVIWYYDTKLETLYVGGEGKAGLDFIPYSTAKKITLSKKVSGLSDLDSYESVNFITVYEGNPYYSSDEYGVLFNAYKTELIYYPAANTRTNYAVPDSVTTIGEKAFYNCKNLTDITIGKNAATIGDNAFMYCNSLTAITIPDSATKIGNSAFKNCVSLKDVCYCGTGDNWNAISIGLGNDSLTSASIHFIGSSIVSGACDKDFTWALYESGLLDIKGTGAMTNWSSSSDVPWRSYLENIKDVNIGNNVTSIGDFSFYECTDLTSITIPDAVTSIGAFAFNSCTGLTSITIPDGVRTIGNSAFEACSNLKDVYYSSTEEDWNEIIIGSDNAPLTFASIHFTEPLIASGTCGDSLTWALHETGLLEITGTGAMTNWSSGRDTPWYSYKSDIKSVLIGDGVTTIGKYAFNYFYYISSITIGNSVTIIGDYAFTDCYNITSITIPDGVTSIGVYAFYCCTNLTNITIGSGVSSIGERALSYSYRLTDITVSVDNPYYLSDSDGVLFNKNMTELIQYPIGKTRTSYTVPDTVTAIGSEAFAFCDNLTSIVFPDSLKTLGEYIFIDCYNLSKVTIPAGIEAIGDYAFGYWTKPYFNGTLEQWKTVETGPNDTYIASKVIICGGTDRPYYIPGTFGKNFEWILYADGELVISGNGDMTNWSSSSDVPWYSMSSHIRSVTIGEGVTNIGNYAFYNCEGITKLTIPGRKTSIGKYAFYGCINLVELTMPVSAQTVANSFGGTRYIRKLTLTAGTGTMQNYSTSYSSSAYYQYTPWYESRTFLKEIVIENGVTNIGNYAFYYNTNLECITIPDSVTAIGTNAFTNCTRLNTVYYGSTQDDWNKISISAENEPLTSAAIYTVTDSNTLGDNLTWKYYADTGRLSISGTGDMTDWSTANETPWHSYSASVLSVIIDDGVTSIGAYAFVNCTNLSDVTIPTSVTSIGSNAFGDSVNITDVHYGSDPDDWAKITVDIGNNALTHAKYHYVSHFVDSGYFGEFIEWELYSDGTLTIVGEGGMYNCVSADAYPWYQHKDKITSVVIDYNPNLPEPIKLIGNYAFQGYPNLTNVKFYSDITVIGNYAFADCSALESITIPDTLKEIKENAFYGCTNIKSADYSGTYEQSKAVTVGAGNSALLSALVFEANSERPYFAPGKCGEDLEWVLYTNGELVITGTGAMTNWSQSSAPWASHSDIIKSVTISDGVTNIGDNAFFECITLTDITIPDSIASIGENAFYGCSVTETNYNGSSEQWNGVTVESGNSCLLSTLIFESDTNRPYYATGMCGENLTWTMYKSGLLEITGTGAMTDYSVDSSSPWAVYSSILKSVIIYKGVTSIGNSAFLSCDSLANVTIPDSVTSIGDSAFSSCESLADIVIPNGLTTIGKSAFASCVSLKRITIPVSLTTIGKSAFSECLGLTNVYYGSIWEDWEKITIGSDNEQLLYADLHCIDSPIATGMCGENLTWAYYAGGLLEITGAGIISGWLTYENIPWHSYCSEITTVNIHGGVTSVGAYALAGCDHLATVHYLGSKDHLTVEENTFGEKAVSIHYCSEMIEIPVSCIKAGISNWYCEACDETVAKNTVISSLGHDWSEKDGACARPNCEFECEHPHDKLCWHTAIKPTCEPGKEKLVCSICGYDGSYKILCDKSTYPKCNISYAEFVDKTWDFAYPGAEKLILHFTEKTSIYEYLYIYNSKGTMVGCYSGSQLSGKEIEVYGDSVKLRIVAETLNYWYGFSFDSIIAVMTVDGWRREIPVTDEGQHDWSHEDGVCTECGYQCPHESISLGVCEECSFCNHLDTDGNQICDNCGGVTRAKILTTDSEGRLYADGDLCYAYASDEIYISSGKYKLTADITTSSNVYILENNQVIIDLNGYTWNMGVYRMSIGGEVSLYDSSVQKTGKLTSSGTSTVQPESYTSPVFNLYSGTVENASLSQSARALSIDGTFNLYGGKIKSSGYALYYLLSDNSLINLDGAILESGKGYAQIQTDLGSYETAKSVIDVADYAGDSLTVYALINNTGKIILFKGVKSIADADRYIVKMSSANGDLFTEKEEYDPETGEKYISVAKNACIKQPSANNNFTADFNNDNASFQWYETEKIVLTEKNTTPFEYAELPQATTSLDKWVVKGECVLFSYDVKAGYSLYVSSESYRIAAYVYVGDKTLEFNTGNQPEPITFDTDTTIYVRAVSNSTTAVLGFTLVKNTLLEGETNETLQKPECGKSYFCRATTQGIWSTSVVESDTVSVMHDWNNSVCSICMINCFEPMNGMIADDETDMIYGLNAGIDSLDEYTALAADSGLKWTYTFGKYGFGTGTVAAIKSANNVIAEYTVVIFGDIDGDGWYDANDAFLVNMIASGLISADSFSEAQFKAADCNHDGTVDSADFHLLNQASILLDDINQSATQQELVTNSVYISYCSLIDQTAGEETNLVPAPETGAETAPETAPETTPETNDEFDAEAIFTTIFDIIKKIFSFVFSFIIK